MGTDSGREANGLTRDQFLKHLRDGLIHLQDPGQLRRSPLAALLGVANRFDTPSALQRILVDAIESLEPAATEPPQSRAWRYYESLYYRYVQRFSQQEVADQLGVSPRQVRREQSAALDVLAYQLWKQFDLEQRLSEGIGEAAEQPTQAEAAPEDELAWLRSAAPDRLTDLNQTLATVVNLVRPLAEQRHVRLAFASPHECPQLAIDPVAFRQMTINLLTAAIQQEPADGQVRVSAKPLRWEVEMQVRCARTPSTARSPSKNAVASLDMARRLASMCGVKLTLSDEDTFGATLILPALEQLPVLAIDDSEGALQLLQRYAAGTRYRLVGTRDAEQALALVEKLSPQIILLDVMMPHIDGWEILGRLRQHPATTDIPVIVCTILAQEELALSLGASGFLRKPVSRQDFLSALDHQIGSKVTGSR